MESGPLAGANPAHPFMVSRPSLSRSPGQPPRPLTLRISFPSPRSGVRRAAPSTPRSGALAATLFGGFRARAPPPHASQFPPSSGFASLAGSRVAEAEARLPAGEFRNRLFPINGALILRGRTGEASGRTPRAGG